MVLKLPRTISTLTRKVNGAIKLAGDWVIILIFIETAYYPHTIVPKFKYALQILGQRLTK